MSLPPRDTASVQAIDYVAVEQSPPFRELKKRHRSFVWPLTIGFLVWYFVYVLLSSYATEFMSTRVAGEITIGLLMGLGQFVTTFAITAIYVSTLVRTHQTAAPLLARLGMEARVEPDLREVFLGDWEGGLLREKVANADPIAVQMYAEERWDVIPNAEPVAALESRVRGSIERIAAAHRDELVVAVAHGGVIGQVMNIATGTTGFRFNGADNASIHHIVVDHERWVVRCFNDTSHLSPTFSAASEPLT